MCRGDRACTGMVRLDRTNTQASLAFATTGAVSPWKVKSERSTWGKTRISANKNSSKISRVQRHRFMPPPIAEQKLIQASRYVNSEGNHLKGQVPRGTADRGFAGRPEKVHASAGDIQQLWDLAVWPGMRADA